MKIKVNGTEAKDIALYFLDMIGTERYTQTIVGRTIRQVKSVMASGYTKDEIVKCIDHIINKGVTMYSFGYVSASINDVLKEIEILELQNESKKTKVELDELLKKETKAVVTDDESARRNAEKAKRFGVQSRFGKKFDFDMFEEK